jgi:hypothetical protein
VADIETGRGIGQGSELFEEGPPPGLSEAFLADSLPREALVGPGAGVVPFPPGVPLEGGGAVGPVEADPLPEEDGEVDGFSDDDEAGCCVAGGAGAEEPEVGEEVEVADAGEEGDEDADEAGPALGDESSPGEAPPAELAVDPCAVVAPAEGADGESTWCSIS